MQHVRSQEQKQQSLAMEVLLIHKIESFCAVIIQVGRTLRQAGYNGKNEIRSLLWQKSYVKKSRN